MFWVVRCRGLLFESFFSDSYETVWSEFCFIFIFPSQVFGRPDTLIEPEIRRHPIYKRQDLSFEKTLLFEL